MNLPLQSAKATNTLITSLFPSTKKVSQVEPIQNKANSMKNDERKQEQKFPAKSSKRLLPDKLGKLTNIQFMNVQIPFI